MASEVGLARLPQSYFPSRVNPTWVTSPAMTSLQCADRYELPINMPAMNTSAPPKAIWNVACRNGVSMKR